MPEEKKASGIYNVFGIVIGLLTSILIWFKWIADGEFTITSVINVAMIWAVIVVVLAFVPKIVGYFMEAVDEYLAKH